MLAPANAFTIKWCKQFLQGEDTEPSLSTLFWKVGGYSTFLGSERQKWDPNLWAPLTVSTLICQSHSDAGKTHGSWARKWEQRMLGTTSQWYFGYVFNESKSILHTKEKMKYILIHLLKCNSIWGDRKDFFSSHMCSIKKKLLSLHLEIDWLTICRFAFRLTCSWNPAGKLL